MNLETFSICFTFTLDGGNSTIELAADVESEPGRKEFNIKNFRCPALGARNILPDIKLKKVRWLWVYSDSGKANTLSLAVGQAIDQQAKLEELHKVSLYGPH